MTDQQRLVKRIMIQVPVTLQTSSGDQVTGTSKDLALFGSYVVCDDISLSTGELLEATIVLADKQTVICAKAKVNRLENDGIVLEFIELSLGEEFIAKALKRADEGSLVTNEFSKLKLIAV